jgi:hypothetical protein
MSCHIFPLEGDKIPEIKVGSGGSFLLPKDCYISGIQMFNRALSDAEIMERYNSDVKFYVNGKDTGVSMVSVNMAAVRSTQVVKSVCQYINDLCAEIDKEQAKYDKSESDVAKRKHAKTIEDYWTAIETAACTINPD